MEKKHANYNLVNVKENIPLGGGKIIMNKLFLKLAFPAVVLMILSIGTVNANAGALFVPDDSCVRTVFSGVSGVVGFECKTECDDGFTDTGCQCYTNQGPFDPFSVFFTGGDVVGACACFGRTDFLCSADGEPGFAQYSKLKFSGLFLRIHGVDAEATQGSCTSKCIRSSSCTDQCLGNQPQP